MRNEEWAKQTKVNYKHKVKIKHRAKRAKGPGTRPWSGSRGETPCGYRAKPLAEYEAEPYSAQADKVQIVVSKADRNRISDKSDIGV